MTIDIAYWVAVACSVVLIATGHWIHASLCMMVIVIIYEFWLSRR